MHKKFLCTLGTVYHPEPPHAQSLFLFPIVFGIDFLPFFDGKKGSAASNHSKPNPLSIFSRKTSSGLHNHGQKLTSLFTVKGFNPFRLPMNPLPLSSPTPLHSLASLYVYISSAGHPTMLRLLRILPAPPPSCSLCLLYVMETLVLSKKLKKKVKCMELVSITSWYPKFNGSHFGLPPSCYVVSLNDWTGWQNRVNYDVLAQAPLFKYPGVSACDLLRWPAIRTGFYRHHVMRKSPFCLMILHIIQPMLISYQGNCFLRPLRWW